MSAPGVARTRFTELSARDRAAGVLDEGSFRELIGPFERLESPHLEPQGIVPQSDDGVVVARGSIDGESAVVASIEAAFQGGGIGEVSGAKIAGSLEFARQDTEAGTPVRVVLLLETGGIRLQEANLGLLALAEIHAAIVALRRHTPVVGVIAGPVGCFGGMSIAAGLCSYLIMTREGRLSLNGPAVIEEEAGVAEFDSADRSQVWGTMGGEQRVATGMADTQVRDDLASVAGEVREAFASGVRREERGSRVGEYESLLAGIDPSQGSYDKALRSMGDGREGRRA